MGRRLIIGILTAALATGAALAQGAPIKIGVFDGGRVSEETEEGKKVAASLNALQETKRAELMAKQKEVEDLRAQLSSQALSLSADKRSSLEKDIQKKGLELDQARTAAQNELQLELGEAQNRFSQQLAAVVEAFGKDEGFVLIIEKSLAAYASPSVDVTTAIVDRFNKLVSATPSPPPSPAPAPEKK